MRLSVLRPSVRKARAFSGSPKSFSSRRSPPAQKAFSPSPPKMITRASSSASARSKAALSAVRTLVETAFTGGLASMIVTIWPSFLYLTSSGTNASPGSTSVELDVRFADHLAPELGLRLHARGELAHRAARLHEALLQQLVLHVLGAEDLTDGLVELRHDRVRRPSRRHQEDPRRKVHVRKSGLLEGGHVRRLRMARGRGHRQQAHAARLDHRQHRTVILHRPVDLAAAER